MEERHQILNLKEFCPFLQEFYEAKKYEKGPPEEMQFCLATFFSHLKKEGMQSLEESFFDEINWKQVLSVVEAIHNLEKKETIFEQILSFLRYCAEEHALICYDEDRGKFAKDLVKFVNSQLDGFKNGKVEFQVEKDSIERYSEEELEKTTTEESGEDEEKKKRTRKNEEESEEINRKKRKK